jgi:hypothetical protein
MIRLLLRVVNVSLIFITTVGAIEGQEISDEKEPSGDKKTYRITSSIILVPRETGEGFVGHTDLGVLPMNAQVAARLTLVNNSEEKDIVFDSIRLHCACEKFDLAETPILAGTSTTGELFFNITPGTVRSVDREMVISLESKARNRSIADIRIKYKVAGLLSFVERISHFEIPSDEVISELVIGFFATSPINFDELVVALGENLGDLACEVEKLDIDRGQIKISCPGKMVSGNGMSGEIMLHDRVSGAKDSHFVKIRVAAPCRIAPEVVRFVEDGSSFSANLVLRVLIPENLKGDQKTANTIHSQSEAPRISDKSSALSIQDDALAIAECFFEDKAIELTTKKMSNGFYRVSLSVDRKWIDNELKKSKSRNLKFHFVGSNWEFDSVVPFIIPLD